MSDSGFIGSHHDEGPVPVSSSSSLDSFTLLELPLSEDAIDSGLTTQSGAGEINGNVSTTLYPSNPQVGELLPPLQAQAFASRSVYQPLILPAPSLSIPGQSLCQPGGAEQSSSIPTSASVPEFLYQLTKMLTENNREIIEWSNGRIEVHNPHKLETHVLSKYFRHSKFASFQRQLNYFGFRKLAGKGKMAPCSYINDAAKGDISSLLLIKRKVSVVPPSKEKACRKKDGIAKAMRSSSCGGVQEGHVNPVLAGILKRNNGNHNGSSLVVPQAPPRTNVHERSKSLPLTTEQALALAQTAAGRGVRHCYNSSSAVASMSQVDCVGPAQSPHSTSITLPDQQESLSQLELNYRNSINNSINDMSLIEGAEPTPLNEMQANYGFLSRTSSLIDLAMIPLVGDNDHSGSNSDAFGLNFDFPDPVYQTTTQSDVTSFAGEQGSRENVDSCSGR